MKTLFYTLTTALLCTTAVLADVARPVLQSSSTKALVDDLSTGGKKISISATGTLEFVSGMTLTGASVFRTAAGLTIGTDVQAYDADLSTYAGITPSANVQTLLGAADYAGMRTQLGLVIGTDVQAYDVDLTTWAGITPGTGIGTFLGTPSSANLAAALTDETGTGKAVFATAPAFTGSIVVNKAGQSEAGGLEVADDESNPSVRALYILPPANSGRIYLGKSGQAAYSLNLTYCGRFEAMPAFQTGSGFTVGDTNNTFINRSYDGGTEIGANTPLGAGLDILQDNSWSNGNITHLALNVHRTNGTTIYGTVTTRTNYEGLNLYWDGTQYVIHPVAGSGGGTVRPVRYHTTGSVFIASGSGSPEGVVTGAVGSIYTRTDGGTGTTLYIKESGTGNTGWVAK